MCNILFLYVRSRIIRCISRYCRYSMIFCSIFILFWNLRLGIVIFLKIFKGANYAKDLSFKAVFEDDSF